MTTEYPRWPWRRLLLANAVIIATYVASYWLRKWLDLPPGYAVALFPPAGVGFALLVVAGWWALPGVVLGALLLDLPALWLPAVAPRVAWVATAAVTLGLTLQSAIGAAVFRRWIDPALDTARQVARFLLLAPAMCLVSAAITIYTLYRLGLVTESGLVGNFLSWWAGDTVGVLLAAPLCWIPTAPPRPLWRHRARPVALPLLLAAAAVLATYRKAAYWETAEHLQNFHVKVQQAADVIQAEFSEHARFVDTLARTLGDSERMLAEDKFERIARGYVEGRAEVRAVNWAVRVRDVQRPAFEAWARAHGAPGYVIADVDSAGQMHPAPRRAEYYAVLYSTPHSTNPARGIDYLGEPGRADAVRRTIRAGQPAASAPLALVTIRRTGISLMRGVGPGAQPAAVIGLILDADSLLHTAFGRTGLADFDFRFLDVTAATAPLDVAGAAWREERRGETRLQLAFADRRYQMLVAPRASYFGHQYGWASWTVLTSGLVLTSLLGAVMLLTSGERARIRALVAERTARLRNREARLQAILDNAGEAIVTLDADGHVVSANAATARLFGYPHAHLAGLSLAALVPAAAGESLAQLLARLATAPPDQRNVQGVTAHGAPVPLSVSVARVRLPTEQLYVCLLRDRTEQQRSQQSIYRLAHHDELTGLENRYALGERLAQQLAQAQRSGEPVAVLFIDLDHFKKINDSHGHATGDQLLVGAARRMKELLRDVDILGRLGGDEFVIVLAGPLTPDSVGAVALRLVHSLAAPYQLAGITVHSGASVGIALFPGDGADGPTLLRNADTAMYAAKREGRRNFQFFSEAMNAATHEHLLLESRMWAALAADGFELHLQAQVELASGRVIGAEALLRWHDPELGQVAPGRFIPVAEESGLILPLGDWVLARSMALLADWQRDGMGHLRLAVNLSARQFAGGTLLARLDELVAQHRIDPARLELEITETAAMRDPEHTRPLLRQLRSRGFKLAIDDFGTGYSSLAYLKLFALDRIKIDRTFVKDIETDPNDAAIVGATISLAHSLGLGVLAEGVETRAQWSFLRDKHSDEAQGYLFARPMPADQFRDFVSTRAQPVPGPVAP